jgi:hypothetical protein
MRADLKRLKRDTDSGRAVAAVGTPPRQGDSSDSQIIAVLVKRHKKALIALLSAGMVIAAALIYARNRAASQEPQRSCPHFEVECALYGQGGSTRHYLFPNETQVSPHLKTNFASPCRAYPRMLSHAA